jgi:hypothetical protein
MSILIQCQLLQHQLVHAANNLMPQRPNVSNAQQVKEATMEAHAKLFLKHVTTTFKYNLINLNAICAKPVQLDRLLSDPQILVVMPQWFNQLQFMLSQCTCHHQPQFMWSQCTYHHPPMLIPIRKLELTPMSTQVIMDILNHSITLIQ